MRLTTVEKKALTDVIGPLYRKAGKAKKSAIPDEDPGDFSRIRD